MYTHCQKCGRPFRCPREYAHGRVCARRLRCAAAVLASSGRSSAAGAAEDIDDGAVVLFNPARRIFRAVSSDGERTYVCTPDGCNCHRGLWKMHWAGMCRHQIAAKILAS